MRLINLLVLSLSLCLAYSQNANENKEALRRKLPLLGGYKPVAPDDLDEPHLLGAAQHAVTQYFATLSNRSGSNLNSIDHSADMFEWDVLDASTQVVAGINFKLRVALKEKPTTNGCVEVFDVIVYDHFGDFSVTEWGDVMECGDQYTGAQNQERIED
uniref:Cystatin domain-containing protein n=1 Tax=Leptocylindrus danicus TaxID=163516 RepID=A0A7S2K1Z1_9STRA|mmetsp:Transcript_16250/g.23929  ORF Transcript_16250/g.23929 Transcript_16250/m.23929 type:complete len:158 (+) Transcript_16250:98-571(+)|eukprot:CAMPEP_0116026920 /NCGR_PEP_ID=MMETSP0321-20121206/14249_1 /TAXON_ID=163516 /ORGANISM="Leptocylindrus danicus var. danicus, Strain B650" /LENGTH=157 /DNA_ID=CAMNT_0003500033 /DNA_START=81 /DNA_END=554 /DNA_ORIENTATION=-